MQQTHVLNCLVCSRVATAPYSLLRGAFLYSTAMCSIFRRRSVQDRHDLVAKKWCLNCKVRNVWRVKTVAKRMLTHKPYLFSPSTKHWAHVLLCGMMLFCHRRYGSRANACHECGNKRACAYLYVQKNLRMVRLISPLFNTHQPTTT